MAASPSSSVASSLLCLASRSRATSFTLYSVSLPQHRIGDVRRVRCQAEGDTPEQAVTSNATSPSTATKQPSPPSTHTPPPVPKISTKFSDVLAFSGPAPERINGRLAMVGFMSAMAVELASGNDLSVQLANGGLTWFAGTAALLSLASLVPLFKGVSAQSRSGGVMTSDAEMWNGRFAMLGLLALAFTEYLKGGPLA